MPIERNKADFSIHVRVPLELLHKLETRVASVAAGREESMIVDPDTGKKRPRHPRDAEIYAKYPATISGLTRKALENFFAMEADRREFALDHFLEEIRTEAETILARAVHDDKMRDVLKRLAKPTEPDFG